jgi:hypothetical protein
VSKKYCQRIEKDCDGVTIAKISAEKLSSKFMAKE